MTALTVTPVQETVNVLPATREVGKAVAKLVADVKAALKSGSTLQEALLIGQAVIADIVPQIGNLTQIPAEIAADPADEVTTALLIGRDVYAALTA